MNSFFGIRMAGSPVSIQNLYQSPIVYALAAICSVGILHSDLSLHFPTTLVLTSIAPNDDDLTIDNFFYQRSLNHNI